MNELSLENSSSLEAEFEGNGVGGYGSSWCAYAQ